MSAGDRGFCQKQRGITLLLSILILLALTFVGLALLNITGYDAVLSGNGALNAAAVQASDAGLAQASQDLQALTSYPDSLNMAAYRWWYVPPILAPSTLVVAAPPSTSFWQTCATSTVTNTTCGVVTGWGANGAAQGVPFAGNVLQVEFVVEPTGAGQQTLNGYEAGSPATSYRLYDTYVYVFRDQSATSHTLESGTLVEAGIRKVGG